jgi:hypothetical protein
VKKPWEMTPAELQAAKEGGGEAPPMALTAPGGEAPTENAGETSVVGDVLAGGGSGVMRGVAGTPGILGDLQGMGEHAAAWGRGLIGGPEERRKLEESQQRAKGTAFGWQPPTSEDTIGAIGNATGTSGAMDYKPKTTAGRIAQVTGEFVGGAAPTAGVGAWLKAGTRAEKVAALAKELVAQGVAPGMVSEVAGQVADRYGSEDLATAVRIGTAIATGTAGTVAHNVTGAPRNVNVPGVGDVRSSAAAKIGKNIDESGGAGFVGQQLDEVGPGGVLADATPGLRGQLVGTNITPGPAQQNVRTFLNERARSMSGGRDTRLNTVLDDIIEPRAANFAEQTVEMRQARRDRANELYGEAERIADGGARPVPLDRARAYIDTLIPDDVRAGITAPLPEHAEMQQLQRFFEGNRTYRDVDQLKDVLQRRIDAARANGQAPTDLIHLKDEVVRSLEDITRGPDGTSPYRAAQRAYREDSGIVDRLDEGRSFFQTKESPGEFQLRWREMTPDEQTAYRMGIRESIANKMDFAGNDFVAGSNDLRKTGNAEKLEMILGRTAAERLQQRVEGLRRQRGTTQDITAQSATEARRRGITEVEDPQKVGNLPPLSRIQSLTGAGTLGAEYVMEKGRKARQQSKADISNLDQSRILTRDLENMPRAQRTEMLERLQEVYRQQGRRQVPPWLLSLQQIYQAERSDKNDPTQSRKR